MAKVYCEFCGQPLDNIDNAEKFLAWLRINKGVARCSIHRKTSRHYRNYDPSTGKEKRIIKRN